MDFKKRYKYLFILLILFTAYNAFFLNKAFHIDDPFTIAMARAVNRNFLNPPPVFFSNPVLLGYYYGPIIKLFGEREIWLHLFYLPFSLLVIISIVFLGKRFANGSLFPTLFLVSTPAFIVTSQNIMLDIPLFGFFLASLALFIYGTDSGNNRLLALSGILAGAAILTKYSGLMLFPILFIYSLLHKKKRSLFFLVIPVAIFLLWILHNIIFYKHSIFLYALTGRLKGYFISGSLIRTFACLIFLSGTSVATLFISPYLLRRRINLFLFLASLPIGLSPFLVRFFSEYTIFGKSIIALLLIVSFFIILVVFKNGLTAMSNQAYNKDKLFLCLWFFILLIFIILSNFIAARFVLLLFPPMFLIIFDEINSYSPHFIQKTKKMLYLFMFLTVSISTALAIGDYYFAGVYRDIAQHLKRTIPPEKQVYFYAGDWGYNYYMIKEGYKPFTCREILRRSHYRYPEGYLPLTLEEINKDLLQRAIFVAPSAPVLPTVGFGRRRIFLDKLSRLKFIKILIKKVDYRTNIIIHNTRFHAGFYSHDWGLLPFYISKKNLLEESFEVYRLTR
ncbi:MAG: phospholipid carrier-dependent glycosyltransferase [Candidatus Omnitrophica bacterium]|nr:phospholipid carrier-dependent glycosyltransferase [Candidatus Omnitrophota bacterium]